MTKFRYRALDPDGNPVEDMMEASSAHVATRKLQERGLTVSQVEEAYPDKRLLRVSNRLQWEELQVLSEQLASIMRSGLPLAASLKALAQDLRHPRLKPVLEGLHQDLDRGTALEDAIERQHDRFPRIYPALIRAGEATGNLPGVLDLIGSQASRMVNLKHRIQTALVYPAILSLVSVIIVAYLMLSVVPVFVDVFRDFGGRLPWPTRVVAGLSEFLQTSWPTMLVVATGTTLGLIIAYQYLSRSQSGRCSLELLRLYTPWTGVSYHLFIQARFCRMMALLLRSRVPILDALELAAAGAGSAVLERASEDAVLSVAAGERLSDALERTRFFGHDAIWLMSTSEERGHTEEAFDSLAARFEREVESHDRFLGAVLSPGYIIFLGFTVGFVMVAMYLPIFTLGDMLGM